MTWTSKYVLDFTSPARTTWPVVTKVSFANEVYELCNNLNLDYDKIEVGKK